MSGGPKQTFPQRRNKNGQQAHEKMLHFTNHNRDKKNNQNWFFEKKIIQTDKFLAKLTKTKREHKLQVLEMKEW